MAIKVGEKDLFPYLGDYGPVSIYKGWQKLAGYKWAEKSGQELHFDNTYNSFVEVEVDGKSYQDAGSGKNLFQRKGINLGLLNLGASVGTILSENQRTNRLSTRLDSYSPVKPNTEYTVSWKIGNMEIGQTDSSNVITDRSSRWRTSSPFTFTTGEFTTRVHFNISKKDDSDISLEDVTDWEIQLEEGSTATEYEPPAPTPDYPIEIHSLNDFDVVSSTEKLSEGQLEEYDYDTEYENIYKINLNLSEPLRSVGDVKDRLFKDSGGLWKIERRIKTYTFTGDRSELWREASNSGYSPTVKRFDLQSIELGIVGDNSAKYPIISNKFISDSLDYGARTHNSIAVDAKPDVTHLRVFTDKVNDVSDFGTWLSINNLIVKYPLANPIIETLSQETQDKLNNLRSFQGSNYVYTVQNTDNPHKEQLTPTLHAKTEVKDI